MSLLNTMNIAASALTAQRFRMDLITNNLANIETTRGADGQPYRRKLVSFQERQMANSQSFQSELSGRLQLNTTRAEHFLVGERLTQTSPQVGGGVQVAAIVDDPSAFRRVYEPGHPDADADGYVNYPNVNSILEMVDMIAASRAYEASVSSHNAVRSMALKALEIGR